MISFPRCTGSTRRAAGLLLLTLPALTLAQTPDALRREAVALDQSAQAVEDAQPATLILHVGTGAEKLIVRSVSVRIDDAPAIKYEFSDIESRALLAGGAHRLSRVSLAEGTHRLRVDLLARAPELELANPRIIAQLDRSFVKQAAPQLIELDFMAEGFISKSGTVAVRESLLGASSDPRGRIAKFFDYSGRGFAPITAGESAYYAQYNAAIAALRSGDPGQGVALLDGIGKSEVTEPDTLALKDQANLTLGYFFIRQRQGESAAAVFNRVRSPGPYSTRGLLGLGWALLAPSGSNRGDVAAAPAPNGQVSTKYRQWPFKHMKTLAVGEQLEQMRRALVPWTELTGRDPMDPAVQEGLLVMPYAMAHIGARDQAQTYYQRAIRTLELTRKRLKEAAAHVVSGGMTDAIDARDRNTTSGWHWQLGDLPEPRWWLEGFPDNEATFYLKHLVADDKFLDALEAYRELHLLSDKLSAHTAQLAADPAAGQLLSRIAALQPDLNTATAAARQLLQAEALAELQRQLRRTENYLAEARLAVARTHDRVIPGDQP